MRAVRNTWVVTAVLSLVLSCLTLLVTPKANAAATVLLDTMMNTTDSGWATDARISGFGITVPATTTIGMVEALFIGPSGATNELLFFNYADAADLSGTRGNTPFSGLTPVASMGFPTVNPSTYKGSYYGSVTLTAGDYFLAFKGNATSSGVAVAKKLADSTVQGSWSFKGETAGTIRGNYPLMLDLTVTLKVRIEQLSTPNLTAFSSTTPLSGGTNITPITVANDGGSGPFSISPALPAGLVFNTYTGTISGIAPSAGYAPTVHTVSVTNAAGTSSLPITIRAKSADGCLIDNFKVRAGDATALRTDELSTTDCHTQSLSLPIGGQSLSTKVKFPAGSLSAPTTFTIASTSTESQILAGRPKVEITAKDNSNADVTSFLKPVAIELTGASSSIASVSSDGSTWRRLALLASAPTTNAQLGATGDGYRVTSLGGGLSQFTIYTSHLTSFGLRGDQAAVTLTSETTAATTNQAVALTASGGSTTNAFTYSTSTPAICSVSASGLVSAQSSGSCSVTATRPGDGSYNDATSAPLSIAFSPPPPPPPPMIPLAPPSLTSNAGSGDSATCTASQYSQEIQSAKITFRLGGLVLLSKELNIGPFSLTVLIPAGSNGKLLECEVQAYANHAVGTVMADLVVKDKAPTPPTTTPTVTPTPTPTPTATPTAAPAKKTTITCVKGKTVKKVTGVAPKCPSGFKKR